MEVAQLAQSHRGPQACSTSTEDDGPSGPSWDFGNEALGASEGLEFGKSLESGGGESSFFLELESR